MACDLFEWRGMSGAKIVPIMHVSEGALNAESLLLQFSSPLFGE